MDINEITETIRSFIIEIAEDMEIPEEKVTNTALFMKEMGLDSMALLEVLATMEKKFGITIPESEFPNISTIEKCAATVQKYLQPKA